MSQMEIMIYCKNFDYNYFVEYVDSFIKVIGNVKVICSDTLDSYDYINDDSHLHVFFCQCFPYEIFNKNLKHAILINTEQATLPRANQNLKGFLAKNYNIIDYSLENIQIIDNQTSMFYLPYQYSEEIDKLKLLVEKTPKYYDVVFMGHGTPRRDSIQCELKNRGINILSFNGVFKDARDSLVSKAKILLNIHCSDEFNVYEAFRCDRWILSGMMVISEKSINNTILDINELVIFEDYHKLVDRIINVVENYDSHYKSYKEKYDLSLENIKKTRYDALMNIKQKFFA